MSPPSSSSSRHLSRHMRDDLGNTYCSRGHIHPPWNTTGILRIAKCESICGFCQKETKTAANLRKHVAIHIKNEGLSLTIAEGSSGRGREIPHQELERRKSSTPPKFTPATNPSGGENFSAPAVLLSMSHLHSHQQSNQTNSLREGGQPHEQLRAIDPPPSQPLQTYFPRPSVQNSLPFPSLSSSSHTPSLSASASSSPSPILSSNLLARFHPQDVYSPSFLGNSSSSNQSLPPLDVRYNRHKKDPYWALRSHDIHTKSAWTAIPSSEGFAMLDYCKKTSVLSSGSSEASGIISEEHERGERVPCYNQKILFDEQWQAHMRDVHGVFLLWPETWMRRIEILDLEPFGGDIRACNDAIMTE